MNRKYLVLKVPGQPPEIREQSSPATLEQLQAIVGGWIEVVPIRDAMPPRTTLFCNEEGKLKDLSSNILIPGDVVVGSLVATAEDDEGETLSLTESEAAAICRLLSTLAIETWGPE